MLETIILSISIVCQLLAAFFALRLIPLTGRRMVWGLVAFALAFMLMAFGRFITLFHTVSGDLLHPPDLTAEAAALSISVLMLIGVASIRPFFVQAARRGEKQRLLSEQIDHSNDAIFIIDPEDGSILDENETAIKTLGYSKGKLLEKKVFDLEETIPDIAAWTEHVDRVRSAGSLVFEGTHRRSDGTTFPVERSVKYVSNVGKDCIVAVVRDISDRLKGEAELRKLSRALEQSRATVIITDTSGSIEYVNPYFTELTGYTVEEALGNNPRILKSGHTTEAQYKELWETISSGDEWKGEFLNRKKNGELYWESVHISPIKDPSGRTTNFLAVKEDITEKKKAEAELKDQYRLQKTLIDTIPNGIFFKDTRGRYLGCNAAFEKAMGLKAGEIEGKTVYDIAPKELADKYKEMDDALFASPGVQTYESRMKFVDNATHDVIINKATYTDSEGKVAGIVGVMLDITDRKRVEEVVRESREKFRTLTSNIPGVVYRCEDDKDRTVTYISDAVEELTGYHYTDFVGNKVLSFASVIHPDDAQTVDRMVQEGVKGRKPYVIDYRVVHKDGSVRHAYEKGQGIFDDSGKILWLDGVIFDITRRKRAEERLRLLNECFLDFSTDPAENIGLLTALGGRLLGGDCAFYNRLEGDMIHSVGAWQAPADFEPWDDAEGRICHDVIRESAGEVLCVRNLPNSSYAKSDPNVGKYGLKTYIGHGVKGDGGLVGALCVLYRRDYAPDEDDNKLLGIIAAAIGVEEERLSAVGELKGAREVALSASRAKSDFLSTMSHEIRTPLTAITGIIEILADTGLSQEQEKYIDVASSAAETLLNLVNDILDFSKIEAGHIELDCEPFDLAAVIKKACDVVRVRGEDKGLECSCTIADGLPAAVIGDPGRLKEVLLNLLGNAVKFTDKGSVSLEVGLHEGDEEADDEDTIDLLFSVKDTGVGIPEDKLKLIFERFSQADASTTRRFGGSGLGLAISKRLVELMGGSIRVESTPGQGSAFYFIARFGLYSGELPTGAVPYNDKGPLPEKALKPVKILLAEDSEFLRIVIARLLGELASSVDEARDGLVALDMFKEGGYDLVLMDMEMPVMDGYTAVRKLRDFEKKNGLEETPVLALTAHATKDHIERSLEAGCNAHLAKPVKKAALLAVVAEFSAGTAEGIRGGKVSGAGDGVGTRPVAYVDPLFKDITPWYLEDIKKEVLAMEEAFEEGDLKTVSLHAHRLKGGGGTFGFVPVSELGRDIEDALEGDDLKEAAGRIKELSAYLKEVKVVYED